MYEYERSIPGKDVTTTTQTGYIGLMNILDDGYTSSACYDTYFLTYYNELTCANTNWLKIGMDEWTITPLSSSVSNAFHVGIR